MSLHNLNLENFMSIYVGNLPYSVTQEDLSKVFSEYGTVKQVQLPVDRETGRARGFGFVEMDTEASETAAIEGLDGAEWMGRAMKVNKARPKEDRGNNRSYGSGGGGGSWGGRNSSGGGGYSSRRSY
jgi:RNA recognition motif-containing protein